MSDEKWGKDTQSDQANGLGTSEKKHLKMAAEAGDPTGNLRKSAKRMNSLLFKWLIFTANSRRILMYSRRMGNLKK